MYILPFVFVKHWNTMAYVTVCRFSDTLQMLNQHPVGLPFRINCQSGWPCFRLRWIRINIEHPVHVGIYWNWKFCFYHIISYTLFENWNIDYYLLVNSFFNFPIYILKRWYIHLLLFIFKMYIKLLEYLFLYYITHD